MSKGGAIFREQIYDRVNFLEGRGNDWIILMGFTGMYNALGYPIMTPDYLRTCFPEQPVEGELYAGPNSFHFVCEALWYVLYWVFL